MDMKYRDRIDIISQILKIANGGGVTRTKIMYRGLLSYAQIKEYLMLLTEKELLRYDKETQTFKTTEKGLRFVDTYNRIGDLMNERQQRQMWIQREEEV
jgi:predicted transcriptional regulator